MKSVFISYAHEDRNTAESLSLLLQSSGYDVWWDHHLELGEELRRKIRSQLDSADKAIVIWSKYSIDSVFVIDEAEVARKSNKLIPIAIGSADPPFGFGGLKTLRIGRPKDGLSQIIAAIEGMTPPPSRVPGIAWRVAIPIALAGCVLAVVAASTIQLTQTSSNCNIRDLEPRFDFKCFRSKLMKIEFVYPKAELTIDVEKQGEGIIPMFNLQKEIEVQITRKSVERPDIQRARDEEKQHLVSSGAHINLSYPQPGDVWRNWYVLSGWNKSTHDEFYYKRWYVQDEVISMEFNYKKERVRTYDDIIKHMVYDKFHFE
jgi:hypothetical protein